MSAALGHSTTLERTPLGGKRSLSMSATESIVLKKSFFADD